MRKPSQRSPREWRSAAPPAAMPATPIAVLAVLALLLASLAPVPAQPGAAPGEAGAAADAGAHPGPGVGAVPLTPPEAPPQVVFAGHWPVIMDPYDVGWAGMSGAARLLGQAGFEVNLATGPLEAGLAWLRAGDVLVVSPMREVRFTAAELDALEDAVRSRGIGLLVLGEHDGAIDTREVMNPLLARFDMSFLLGIVNDPAHPDGFPLADFPDLGVEDIVLGGPGILELTGPEARALSVAGPETTRPGAVMAAEAQAGAGRVVALADMEVFWNGEPAFGPTVGNTSRLYAPLFARLAGSPVEDDALGTPSWALATVPWQPASTTGPVVELRVALALGASAAIVGASGASATPLPAGPGEAAWEVEVHGDGWLQVETTRGGVRDRDLVRVLAAPSVPGGGAATRLLVALDGDARGPGAGPSGLLDAMMAFRDAGLEVTAARVGDVHPDGFDAVLLVAPLADLGGLPAALDAWPAAARLAVLAEPWSTTDCDTDLCGLAHGLGAQDPPLPLAALTTHLGARLAPGLAYLDEGDPRTVEWPTATQTLDGATAQVWRASGVVAEPGALGAGLREHSYLAAPGWQDLLGTAMSDGVVAHDFPDDLRRPRFLRADDTRLLAGDADGLTNLHQPAALTAWLADWLRGPGLGRAMPGSIDAGGGFEVVLSVPAGASAGAGEAWLEERLPAGVTVTDGGGAEVQPQPEGATLLRWWLTPGEAREVRYQATTLHEDAWLPLPGRLLADDQEVARSDAPLRLRVPAFEAQVAAPDVLPAGEVAVAMRVLNVGDGTAQAQVVDHEVGLLHLPWPSALGPPPRFGDPEGEVTPTGEAWRLRWGATTLPAGSVTAWNATWRAPALVGAYDLHLVADAQGLHGHPAPLAAMGTYEVLLLGPPPEG